MSIEFRKQSENKIENNSLVESLRSKGMSNLESVNFVSLRLLHGTTQDGINAVNNLLSLKDKPEIILLELVRARDEDLSDIQDYVLGKDVKFPRIRNEFVEGLATALREYVKESPEYQPLIVCSEARDKVAGTYKVDQALSRQRWARMILFDRFRSDSYEYLLDMWEKTCVDIVEAQRERDIFVAQNFTEELTKHKYFASLAPKASITIGAPYGVLHGRLSEYFKSMGAQVFSAATALLNKPSEKCNFLLKYEQPVTDEVFEESMLAYIVESALEMEEDYKALTERQQNALAWSVLRLIVEKYGSFKEAILSFRKQMKSKGESREFSREIMMAMSNKVNEKYVQDFPSE